MVTTLSKLAALIQEGSVPAWVRDEVSANREKIIEMLNSTGAYELKGPNGETVEIRRAVAAAA